MEGEGLSAGGGGGLPNPPSKASAAQRQFNNVVGASTCQSPQDIAVWDIPALHAPE